MTTINSPIVDITALNAVESLLREGVTDPWAKQAAGQLVDFIIYADRPRFILPSSRDAAPTPVPKLLSSIRSAEPGLFRPETYSPDLFAQQDLDLLVG